MQPEVHAHSHQLLADHITKQVLKALSEVPGNTFIGSLPVKHKIAKPASADALRAQFRQSIEIKFNKKWNQ